ncbi:MAG: tol-pal system-associated acyl-CoA thioesterase [Acetobacterales bacterium]
MPEAAARSSGRLTDGVHVMPIRVYFADTDAGGVVHHASYLSFAERARTEMLRLLGFDQGHLMREHGLVFAVRQCEIDFLSPAHLDELLELRTSIVGIGGSSVKVSQSLWHDARELVRMLIRLVCVRLSDVRPARLPADIRVAFEGALQPQAGNTT